MFTWKHLCWGLIFNKGRGWKSEVLLKKTPVQVFSHKFCENFKSNYFEEHLHAAVSFEALFLCEPFLKICFNLFPKTFHILQVSNLPQNQIRLKNEAKYVKECCHNLFTWTESFKEHWRQVSPLFKGIFLCTGPISCVLPKCLSRDYRDCFI